MSISAITENFGAQRLRQRLRAATTAADIDTLYEALQRDVDAAAEAVVAAAHPPAGLPPTVTGAEYRALVWPDAPNFTDHEGEMSLQLPRGLLHGVVQGRLQTLVAEAVVAWAPLLTPRVLGALLRSRRSGDALELFRDRRDFEIGIQPLVAETARSVVAAATTTTSFDDRTAAWRSIGGLQKLAPIPSDVRRAMVTALRRLPAGDPDFDYATWLEQQRSGTGERLSDRIARVMYADEPWAPGEKGSSSTWPQANREAEQLLDALLADPELEETTLTSLAPWIGRVSWGFHLDDAAAHRNASDDTIRALIGAAITPASAARVGTVARAWAIPDVRATLLGIPAEVVQTRVESLAVTNLVAGAPPDDMALVFADVALRSPTVAASAIRWLTDRAPERCASVTDDVLRHILADAEGRGALLRDEEARTAPDAEAWRGEPTRPMPYFHDIQEALEGPNESATEFWARVRRLDEDNPRQGRAGGRGR